MSNIVKLKFISFLIVILFLLLLPYIFSSSFALTLFSKMGVLIIFSVAYNMLLGQTGLLSFGYDDHCPWDFSSSKMDDVIDFVSEFLYQNINCESIEINELNLNKDEANVNKELTSQLEKFEVDKTSEN